MNTIHVNFVAEEIQFLSHDICKNYAMSQEISHRLLMAQTRVRSQAILCKIRDKQGGSATGFLLGLLRLSLMLHAHPFICN